MSKITSFPNYKQRENITTNYCLLLFKTIYDESPRLFKKLLSDLMEEEDLDIGITFEQQRGFKTSKGTQIFDGSIKQEPLNIYIETKLSDWFYGDQINGYLEKLNQKNGQKFLLLLSNFEERKKIDDKIEELESKTENLEGKRIKIKAIEFEQFLNYLQKLETDNDIIRNMVTDLEEYFTEEGLLPVWKYRLDIVPCGLTLEENLKTMSYSCLNTGGAYYHSRSKYFGFYKNKKVDSIAEIDAVINIKDIDLSDESNYELEWKNSNSNDCEIIKRAKQILSIESYYGTRELLKKNGILLFLLSNKKDNVGFIKGTPGGIWGRQYKVFKSIDNIDQLFEQIQNKKWAEI